jgi:hypothetical protein
MGFFFVEELFCLSAGQRKAPGRQGQKQKAGADGPGLLLIPCWDVSPAEP